MENCCIDSMDKFKTIITENRSRAYKDIMNMFDDEIIKLSYSQDESVDLDI